MTYYRSGKIVIKCAEPMPTQVDGDPSGEATTVTVRVAPRSLLVRVREDPAREELPHGGGAAGKSGSSQARHLP
jgi:diacylglycerol kinase family enzyme